MSADPNRVRDVFLAAAEIPTAERSTYLAAVCGADVDLRAAVDRLLAAHAEPASILDPPPLETTRSKALSPADAAAFQPDVVLAGRYKLLQRIGEGGMGEVWVAKQDEPVKRKVALKLIKTGMDSKAVLARFEAERQALAMMDHPNIAKVLDGGITSSGQPFFVMELVNGMPLTKFCDEARLPPKARLELFVPICQAVQHAHQKGIVHRDLKPANILVTLYDGRPVPKVIDFGVAKALAGKLTEESLSTQFGAVVGTFEYMAPEQAGLTAIDIDTRADIYSLGVILYELLTGLRPFDGRRLRKAALDEMVRIIREEEPSKPSTRLSTDEALPSLAAIRQMEPKGLMASLRGDLDSIIMKALEKDRNRRYETANGFARDVQHFLADEPVEAQPPSMAYRLRKFLRRNRGRVLATSIVLFTVFASLLAGTAAIIWYQGEAHLRKAADDHKRALVEQSVRNALDDTEKPHKELHATLAKPGGVFALLNDPARWEGYIQSARASLRGVNNLLANAGGGIDPALPARAAALDEMLRKDESDRLLAEKLEKIRLDRLILVDNHFDYRSSADQYPLVFAEFHAGDFKVPTAGVAAHLAASPIKEQLLAALDDWAVIGLLFEPKGLPDRLLEIGRLAAPDPAWGDRLRRIEVCRDQDALADLIKAAPGDGLPPSLLNLIGFLLSANNPAKITWLRHAQTQYPGDFWLNLNLGSSLQRDQGDSAEEAAGFLRAAIAVRPKSSVAYSNLGVALAYQKSPEEAVAAYRKAIALDGKNARAYSNLGVTFAEQKKLPESLAAYQKAIAIAPKLASAYNNLGNVLRTQKKLPQAVAAYRKAITLDATYSFPHHGLGNALRDQNKLPEAIAAYEKAIKLDPKFAFAYNNLGIALHDQKKLPEAVAAFLKAIELDPKDSFALSNLGNALYEQKKLPEAIAAFQKAINYDPTSAKAYHGLGAALREQNKLSEAIVAYQKAIDLDSNFARAYSSLGVALNDQKKWPDAVAAHEKAIALEPKNAVFHYELGIVLRDQAKLPGAIAAFQKAIDFDPKFVAAYSNLGEALRKQKNLPEAVAAFQKAVEIEPHNAIAYFNLGNTLLEEKKLPEAIAAYHMATGLEPKLATAYSNLGTALRMQNKLSDAVAAYQKAIDADPKYVEAYYNLANVLHGQKKLPDAIAAFQKALALAPGFAEAHCNLGHALKAAGDFGAALNAMRKGHDLGNRRPGWRYPSAAWVKDCEALVALENQLALVLTDKASATPAELLQMASMCQQYQKRYATAVSLYRQAFKVEPKLADDLGQRRRYSAACVAALAGTVGDARTPTTDEEKASLRNQARDWLQGDLGVHAKLVKDGNAESITQTESQLSHWLLTPDLTDVRGPKIAALPEAEQAAWRKLWADVDLLLTDTRTHITETAKNGTLTDNEREQVHEMKLDAGKFYVFEMKSTDFDSYLKLHDAAGKLLAENDDIAEDNQDSRIIFMPSKDGVYRITASSYRQVGRGAYTLTIRAVVGKK